MASSYDSIAEEWHASRIGFPAQKYVDLILRRLRPNARILDLGCGTGEPISKHLIENGCAVVGVDASARMLEIARNLVPQAKLVQADMRNFYLNGRFEAVVAWDSVFHVSRTEHEQIFRNISNMLVSGGWLLLSAGASAAEGFTSEMFGHTFFYSAFEPDELIARLATNGLQVELCEEDDPSSKGHIALIATKA